VIAPRDLGGQAPATRPERPAGGLVDRRTLLGSALRGAAAASLALWVPGGLGGCSTYIRPAPRIRGFVIDVGPLPPGLAALIAERAARIGIPPQTNVGADAASQRAAAFTGRTERQAGSNFDPVYDRSPRTADLVVVQADPSLDPVARAVMGQGVQVITYLAPLRHQTAEITLDAASLGALLATDAARWEGTRLHNQTTVLFVRPPPGAPAASPDYAGPPAVSPSVVEAAIRATFSRLVPSAIVRTVANLSDPVAAVKADPTVRIILCANDNNALGVAQILRRQVPRARRDELYVGGLGSPSIGQSGTPAGQGDGVEPWVRELRRSDVLRALATVRLRDLADALVNLPAALIGGKPAYDVRLSPVLLRPRSPELAQYARDSLR
jgi:hypothetical protein